MSLLSSTISTRRLGRDDKSDSRSAGGVIGGGGGMLCTPSFRLWLRHRRVLKGPKIVRAPPRAKPAGAACYARHHYACGFGTGGLQRSTNWSGRLTGQAWRGEGRQRRLWLRLGDRGYVDTIFVHKLGD